MAAFITFSFQVSVGNSTARLAAVASVRTLTLSNIGLLVSELSKFCFFFVVLRKIGLAVVLRDYTQTLMALFLKGTRTFMHLWIGSVMFMH